MVGDDLGAMKNKDKQDFFTVVNRLWSELTTYPDYTLCALSSCASRIQAVACAIFGAYLITAAYEAQGKTKEAAE